MADYYLEFSQVLPHLSDEEFAWLEEQLTIVHVFGGQEFSETSLPAELDAAKAEWSGYRFYRDYEDDPLDTQLAGFCFELEQEAASDFGRHLWVYSEDSGNLGPLGHVVQKFLRRFRPGESWAVTYASSCSKPRVDSFGGGAMFVTTDEIKFEDSWAFADREAEAFQERQAQAAK